MPRAQNYERQVNVIALPNARLTAAPDIGSAGAVGNQLLRAGAEMYADEVRKQDEIAVLEADRKMSEWETKRLYDPQGGALTRRGKDAFGLPDQVGQELDETIGQIRGSLSNERQRMAFDRRAIARKTDINTALSKHVFGEIRKHDDAETENYIANSRQAAVLNYSNLERVGLEIERQRAAVIDYASRNGLGAEYVKQKIAQVHSDTHVNVIDRMLANGQDQGAKAYFDSVRTDIAGSDITKVEAKMQTALTEGAAMRSADDVWKTQGPKSDTDPVNIDTMAEALKEKHGGEPGVLKAAIAALKERAALHNAAQKERAEASAGAVWKAVADGANLATVTRSPQFLSMPGSEQARVRDYIVRQAEHNSDRAYMLGQRARTAREQAETDASKANFSAYLRYSNVATLDAMSEDQIIAKLPELGRTLTGSLMERKRSIMKSEQALRDASIDDDLFKEAAQSAGLQPYRAGLSEEKRATLGALKNAAETAIDVEQRSTGRAATRARKQQIVQEIVDRKVKLDVFGPDPERIAALVKKDDRDKAYVPIERIPKQTVAEALNYLRSHGRIPLAMTDAQALKVIGVRVERAYAARLMGATALQIATVLETAPHQHTEKEFLELLHGPLLFHPLGAMTGAIEKLTR